MTTTEQHISEITAFDHGDRFADEAQVRNYFTAASQQLMFGEDAITDQAQLDEWADYVIANRLHMADADA